MNEKITINRDFADKKTKIYTQKYKSIQVL